jgi:hypothetical protein
VLVDPAAAVAPHEDPPPPAPARVGSRDGRRKLLAWTGAAAALAALLLAGVTIYARTDKGTLVIESDDPNVGVSVKNGGGVVLHLGPGEREVSLPVGAYGIELTPPRDGLQLSTREFVITRGGKNVVSVRWEKEPAKPTEAGRPAPAPKPPGTKHAVADLQAVQAFLREINVGRARGIVFQERKQAVDDLKMAMGAIEAGADTPETRAHLDKVMQHINNIEAATKDGRPQIAESARNARQTLERVVRELNGEARPAD